MICQTDTELTFMAASYAGRMMLLSLLVGQTLSGFVIISFTVLNLISVLFNISNYSALLSTLK